MLTILKVLGLIWLGSIVLIGLTYLWCKITRTPFVVEYDGEDF